jgi:hypothetical protein
MGSRKVAARGGLFSCRENITNNAVSSGRSNMFSKVLKIVVDAVLSLMFLIVASILINAIASVIFGKKPNGDADFNGHILLAITVAITLVFAWWFYKYVSFKKSK